MKKLFLLCSLIAGFGTLSAQQQPSLSPEAGTHQPGMHHHPGMTELEHPKMPEVPKPDHEMPSAAERVAQMKNGTTQLCDSMISTYEGNLNSKEVYNYDIHGNRTSFIRSYWDSYLCVWNNDSRSSYEYNSDNQLTLYTNEYWNGSEWYPNSKQEYTYNDRGQETSYTYYRYQNETWNYNSKKESVFDNNGYMLSNTYFVWENEAWRTENKYEYTHDANGHETSYTSYYWDWSLQALVGSYKYEYFYNDYGRQTGYAGYNWNYEQSQWVGFYKYEDIYDDNGRHTSYISYTWNSELNQWVGDYKYEYTYSGNYQTGHSYYTWENGQWVLTSQSKYDLTFDANGYATEEIDYYFEDGTWKESAKYTYTFDENGRQTSYTYYSWDGGGWMPQAKAEMAYDSNDYQTLNVRYKWKNGDWQGDSKEESEFDSYSRRILYARYTWRKGAWVMQSREEYSYDEEGRQTSRASYQEEIVKENPYVINLNFGNDPILDHIDEQGLLFTGSNYTVDALYADQFVLGHDDIQYVPVWNNNGSLGEINWSPFYRFSSQNNSTGEECYAFPMETWNKIKEGTVRVNITCDDPSSAIIYITSGWWAPLYGGQTYIGTEIIQTDADGQKYLLINLKEEGNLINYIDERQLLFTGQGYTIESICLLGLASEITDADSQKKIFWENDGTHGEMAWTGEYRFGAAGSFYTEECIATFSAEDWELLKTQPFRVEIEKLADWVNIRLTTGWWSTNFMGMESLNDLIEQDPDGTYYVEINLQDDPDFLSYVDDQNLLFTGQDYRILRITSCGSSQTVSVSNDDLLEITEDGYWKRHNLWKNDGNYGEIYWGNQYLFNCEEHSSGREIATLSAEDWALLKSGNCKAAFHTYWSSGVQIRVTTGWWNGIWTGSDLDIHDEPITGGPEYEFRGQSKNTIAFDELGNTTSETTYRWINGEWVESYTYIYYYSAHTDIREVLQEPRPRVSKQLRNGQVIIVIGDKAYNIAGEELK